MRKLKILLISFGSIAYDGRLRELLKVCQLLGDCTYITNDSKQESKEHIAFAQNSLGYLDFIRFCQRQVKNYDNYDIVFADNRRALFPAYKIYKKQKKAKFIIDARELYLPGDKSSLVSKAGTYLEKWLNPKADIVIAANRERANIMHKYYQLKELPIVFENVRALQFPTPYKPLDNTVLEQEVLNSLAEDKLKLISTSGCSVSRTNDVLVKAVAKFPHEVNLYLVGAYGNADENTIRQLIADQKIKNVYIIGKNLNEGQLKEMIQACDVGVVNYHMLDTNNIYCASGKIYEFLAEDKPVLTTENPPLLNMVEKYQIGTSDNQYVQGIEKLLHNYAYYQDNVIKHNFKEKVSDNNQKLANHIKNRL